MKILIIGEERNLREFESKFGTSHEITCLASHGEAERFLDTADLVFDFIIDEEPEEFEIYTTKKVVAFLNTCKFTLSDLYYSVEGKVVGTLFGFNGLPTFLDRDIFEVSLYSEQHIEQLSKACAALGTGYLVVDDRVGLVTPRVICMIINEAFFTVQEGTASREDIDMAMKLGTNYPFGPFEWCEKIGLRHVYELLEALYNDTNDERYKICPLMKKEYLRLQ